MTTPFGENKGASHLILFGLLLGCLIAGWIISQTSLQVSASIVLGVVVILATLVNSKIGLLVLIFSMLLSPEISLSGRETMAGADMEAKREVTIRLDDLLLMLICFVWLAKGAILKNVGLIHRSPLNKFIFIYLLISVSATVLGMINGNVSLKSGFFFNLKYAEYFVLYFIVVNLVQTSGQKDFPKQLINAMFITAFIVSIFAISQIGGDNRVSAPFEGEAGEANTLGMYLLLIGSIAFGLILNKVSPSLRRYLWLFLFILLVPYLATLSRASYMASGGAILMFIFLSKNRIWIILFSCLAVFVAPFLLPQTVLNRVFFTFNQQFYGEEQHERVFGVRLDTSTSERIKSYKKVFKDIQKRPLFGYGVTGYKFVDGQYFKVLIDSGLLGLSAFLVLLYQILKGSIGIFRKATDPYLKGLAMGFIASFAGMLVHALGSNTFIIIRIMEPFCLLMGIVFMIPYIERVQREQTSSQEQQRT